jgi:hypothetical protein
MAASARAKFAVWNSDTASAAFTDVGSTELAPDPLADPLPAPELEEEVPELVVVAAGVVWMLPATAEESSAAAATAAIQTINAISSLIGSVA